MNFPFRQFILLGKWERVRNSWHVVLLFKLYMFKSTRPSYLEHCDFDPAINVHLQSFHKTLLPYIFPCLSTYGCFNAVLALSRCSDTAQESSGHRWVYFFFTQFQFKTSVELFLSISSVIYCFEIFFLVLWSQLINVTCGSINLGAPLFVKISQKVGLLSYD